MKTNRFAVFALLFFLMIFSRQAVAQDGKKAAKATVCAEPTPSRSRAIAQAGKKNGVTAKAGNDKSCCVRTPSRLTYLSTASQPAKKAAVARQ